MEMIILLLLIVFFIIYLNNHARQREDLRSMSNKLTRSQAQVEELKKILKEHIDKSPVISSPVPPPAITKKESLPDQKQRPAAIPQKPIEPPSSPQAKPLPDYPDSQFLKPSSKVAAESSGASASWLDQWWKNNPDLEKFIGENLVNKIGIAILVLGVSFFVKYAIDKNWINEIGRVGIGFLCGMILVGLAHRLRNSYRSFSSVLAGGGIAIFYFTIAFAFHQYALISQTAAFLLMVVITGFAVMLSLLYDKTELAVIAAVGGFLTPFLVSNGQGNYVVLFTYLIILNTGLLALSYYKRWRLINILSLLFTIVITAGWMMKTLLSPTKGVSFILSLVFITVLYMLFLGMNMVYQVSRKQTLKAFDFSLLLFLTSSYYAGGMILLGNVNNGMYQGVFTLITGMIDLILAWFFMKRKTSDKKLVYLLIGLTLTFISLTIPVQLQGHTITLFWSLEFVLLYWLFQRSGIWLFKLSSCLVLLLAVISLLMDWNNAAMSFTGLFLIYTGIDGIVTNIVAATAFASYARLLIKENTRDDYLAGLSNRKMIVVSITISLALFYVTAFFGPNLYFREFTSNAIPNTYQLVITEIFVLVVGGWLGSQPKNTHPWLRVSLLLFAVLFYFFSIHLANQLRNGVLNGSNDDLHLWVHWLGSLLLVYVFYSIIKIVRRNAAEFESYFVMLNWLLCILIIAFFSFEFKHIYISSGYAIEGLSDLSREYSKAVLTILWALCSFVLMWMGMQYKNKTLRIVSLTVFTVALLKLFFSDIRNISEGGKIAAFILLGILLLTISFMYQKLKKIIITDEI